ncbi:MAG: transporter substrate-binding domain-containing protein [Muribaculaceae bacterium]|nr:transporter substrate-binding domain-containing protein [Muribaculaceae bacterium]
MKTIRLILLALLSISLPAAFQSCRHGGSGSSVRSDGNAVPAGDTLRVVTLYGPTSFFIYRGDSLGYDYTLAQQFCQAKGLEMKLTAVKSLGRAIELVDSGKADLIAYEVPITAHYKELVKACGPENYTRQVLVQGKVKGKAPISDVTQLVGKTVYVEKDSKYLRRMQNLNEELGGGIDIKEIDTDTLITEDLIEMVSDGKIPLTVVDSDVAMLNETYFHDLDISLDLSAEQRQSWAVARNNQALADEINEWFAADEQKQANDELLKRYFEQSKSFPKVRFNFDKGYISDYDGLFKNYAPGIGWDWRLLAAQGYVESRFNPSARSWVGARGLMQIMPSTGRGYGQGVKSLGSPGVSVRVATRLLSDLDRQLRDYVPNDKERVKFVIAAYNCGAGHVFDAIRLAKKYGMDPQVWDGNVAKALLMKMQKKYYNDDVVRYGYARGSETVSYVKQIMAFYEHAKRVIPM